MDRLGVSMLCPLDKQRHDPGRHGSYALPIKRLMIENEPDGDVNADYDERQWVGGRDADLREP